MKKERKNPILFFVLSLFLTFGICGLFSVTAHADGELAVTSQPESVEVHYPDGAEFHVEVNDPSLVESWQWHIMDIAENDFVLTGSSAKTDTLTIPATEQGENTLRVFCVITDKNGNEIVSEEATLDILNNDEDRTVLYVGEYAVEPGETLDLSKTVSGTGKVTFDRDGSNITLDNVTLDSTERIYDGTLGASLGIFLMRRNSEETEYYFHVKGDCLFKNTFYDADYNSAGVVFNAFFGTGSDGNKPNIIIDGDGTLTLWGGGHGIYTDANVEINTKLVTEPNGDIFHDGIQCYSLFIDGRGDLELTTNGSGIFTNGDLYLYDGAKLNIQSTPQRVSVGPTAKNIVSILGTMYAKGAEISIRGNAKADTFIPYGSALVYYNGIALQGIGAVNLDSCTLDIEITAEEGDQPYALNFNGITGPESSNALVMSGGSKVRIKIDDPQVRACGGITLGGLLEADKDSEVIVDVHGLGETAGIELGRTLDVTDANIDVTVRSEPDEESGYEPQYATYGIATGGADISISGPDYKISSLAENGLAFAADTGETEDTPSEYTDGYEAQVIRLTDKAQIVFPAEPVISTLGVPGYDSFIKAEAVFNSKDTSKPASQVIIAVEGTEVPPEPEEEQEPEAAETPEVTEAPAADEAAETPEAPDEAQPAPADQQGGSSAWMYILIAVAVVAVIVIIVLLARRKKKA